MKSWEANRDWRRALTRISVSGAGDHFVVRSGDERPVRVWTLGGELRCECDAGDCAHVESIILCGFHSTGVGDREERKAA